MKMIADGKICDEVNISGDIFKIAKVDNKTKNIPIGGMRKIRNGPYAIKINNKYVLLVTSKRKVKISIPYIYKKIADLIETVMMCADFYQYGFKEDGDLKILIDPLSTYATLHLKFNLGMRLKEKIRDPQILYIVIDNDTKILKSYGNIIRRYGMDILNKKEVRINRLKRTILHFYDDDGILMLVRPENDIDDEDLGRVALQTGKVPDVIKQIMEANNTGILGAVNILKKMEEI